MSGVHGTCTDVHEHLNVVCVHVSMGVFGARSVVVKCKQEQDACHIFYLLPVPGFADLDNC